MIRNTLFSLLAAFFMTTTTLVGTSTVLDAQVTTRQVV